MSDDNAMVILNVSIYQWQRQALEALQRQMQQNIGEFSLAQAARLALSKALPRPETQDEEQPA